MTSMNEIKGLTAQAPATVSETGLARAEATRNKWLFVPCRQMRRG